MKQRNLGLLILAVTLLPLGLHAGAAGPWRFDSALNLFAASLSGDVAMKGQPASVDASFGDIAENLDFAAAGRLTLARDRWSLSTEFSYMKLGVVTPAASVEFKQWLVEPTVGYRFCDGFEAFAGARWNSMEGTINFTGPLGLVRSGTQDWWDPIVGVNLSVPLSGEKLALNGRCDVGGFGAGSDLTWQVYPSLSWRFAKAASLQLGYRWLATDYETGSGASLFRYDVTLSGPQIGLTFHF